MFPISSSTSRSTTFPVDNPSSSSSQFQQSETPPLATNEKSTPRQPGWTSELVTQAREVLAGSTVAIEKKEDWLNESVYRDPSFTALTVEDYTAKVLNTKKGELANKLLKTLSSEKQTGDNLELINNALARSVNASGAVMMVVNTENGPHLVAAHSQRRGMLIQTNGQCEKGESMQETASREFFEELGNPPSKGILSSVLLNEENYHGVKGINKIGDNASELANRIIDKKAIYVNASALYANKQPVSQAALDAEIKTLNKRLNTVKNFYPEACQILFGDRKTGQKPSDLEDPAVREHASEIIGRFKKECPGIITSGFVSVFAQHEANPDDPKSVKKALNAIVDLSENDRIELLNADSVKAAMDLHKNNFGTFKKNYFAPGFEVLYDHIGKRSPDEFFNFLAK